MKTARIENWATCRDGSGCSPYTAPELYPFRLYGEVYGHPNFPDGKRIITSTIQFQSDTEIVTRNTTYKLGKPSEAMQKVLERRKNE